MAVGGDYDRAVIGEGVSVRSGEEGDDVALVEGVCIFIKLEDGAFGKHDGGGVDVGEVGRAVSGNKADGASRAEGEGTGQSRGGVLGDVP